MSTTEPTQSPPWFSLVLAALNAERTIVPCLEAWLDDLNGAGVSFEIIVADGSTDASAECAAAACPEAQIIRMGAGHLIPELWSRALAGARGSIVGVATAHCIPVPGWTRAMLAAHALGYRGIGGAIECAGSASIVDRAIYFTRYSSYMLPFSAREVDDLPGDNVCYDGATLRQFPAYIEGPFWEPFLHAEMRRDGIPLRMDPAAVVTYVHSFGAREFLRQRFAHGWHFGRMRSHSQTATRRLLVALSYPLLVAIVTWRVARRVWHHTGQRRHLLKALPLVTLFLGSFLAGECTATLLALRPHEIAGPEPTPTQPHASATADTRLDLDP
jgi:hypothetical protein